MMQMLEVNQLTKIYGQTKAVNTLSFRLTEGRCVALLGPNGAGKTTTLNMLSGLIKPTSGAIRFRGSSSETDIRTQIGYLPQYAAFYPWMTGREFLVYAGELARLNKRIAGERADELLRLVGLEDARSKRIGGYSGGMKQRLGLAQAMIHQPKLLILDEPVSALDPIGRREVLELLKQLKQQTTILFSTHVLPDAEEVCDDVLIIRQGEIVISGSLSQVRTTYQQPIIEIDYMDEASARRWLGVWQERYRDISIERQGTTLKLTTVSELLDKLGFEIMQQLAREQAPVRRLELGHSTLEDLFMKAVKQ